MCITEKKQQQKRCFSKKPKVSHRDFWECQFTFFTLNYYYFLLRKTKFNCSLLHNNMKCPIRSVTVKKLCLQWFRDKKLLYSSSCLLSPVQLALTLLTRNITVSALYLTSMTLIVLLICIWCFSVSVLCLHLICVLTRSCLPLWDFKEWFTAVLLSLACVC